MVLVAVRLSLFRLVQNGSRVTVHNNDFSWDVSMLVLAKSLFSWDHLYLWQGHKSPHKPVRLSCFWIASILRRLSLVQSFCTRNPGLWKIVLVQSSISTSRKCYLFFRWSVFIDETRQWVTRNDIPNEIVNGKRRKIDPNWGGKIFFHCGHARTISLKFQHTLKLHSPQSRQSSIDGPNGVKPTKEFCWLRLLVKTGEDVQVCGNKWAKAFSWHEIICQCSVVGFWFFQRYRGWFPAQTAVCEVFRCLSGHVCTIRRSEVGSQVVKKTSNSEFQIRSIFCLHSEVL